MSHRNAAEMGVRSVGPSRAELFQRPPAWDTLAQGLSQQRPVWVGYHGHDRLLCPHVLGWTKGRAKMLAYQAAGGTSTGPLLAARQRWRSMFVDEVEDPVITDGRWESAENYCGEPDRIGMDLVEMCVGTSRVSVGRSRRG